MFSAEQREELARLKRNRDDGGSRLDQYLPAKAPNIIETVSEEEYKRIQAARREEFVVGERTLGYDDAGKELWDDPAALRVGRTGDAARTVALAATSSSIVENQHQHQPDGHLMKAFGAGARSTGVTVGLAGSAALNSSQQRSVDDLLQQMCGEMEENEVLSQSSQQALQRGAKRITAAPTSDRGGKRKPELPKIQTHASSTLPPPSVKPESSEIITAPIRFSGPSLKSEMNVLPQKVSTVSEPFPLGDRVHAPIMSELPTIKTEPMAVEESYPDRFDVSVADNGSAAAMKRKRDELDANRNGAAGMRSWLAKGVCPGVEAMPHAAASSSPPSPPDGGAVVQEADGGLWFFLVDAVEDDRSNRVYLFGKVKATNGFQSCCFVVERFQRSLYLLLNVEDPQDELLVREVAQRAEAEFDDICKRQWPGLKKQHVKVKHRNYAFEKPLPYGDGHLAFLKVFYETSGGQPPSELKGDAFCHAFGLQTSLLEWLLIHRRIMGPSWLRLLPGSFTTTSSILSFCPLELRGTPASIFVPKTLAERQSLAELGMPSTSPPLRVLSLAMQTVQASAQHGHEPVAIVCTLHRQVNAESASWEDLSVGAEKPWAVVRRLDSRPFPRDAEQLLQKEGVVVCGSEVALLEGFLTKVQEFDPDVITGYNAYGFDLDVLASRLAANKIQVWQKLGRLRRKGERIPQGRTGGFWAGTFLTAGRLVSDVLLQAREMLRLNSYDLHSLAKAQQLEVDADGLKDIEPEALAGYYKTKEELFRLVERTYRIADALWKLSQSLQILPLTKQLSNLAGNLWNNSLQNRRAERNELLLCHEFHKSKFLLPDKESALMKKRRAQHGEAHVGGLDDAEEGAEGAGPQVGPRRGKAQYTGGMVLEPKSGLYDDLILMLDFNSLYPSIIQEYNICFSTVERPNENQVAACRSEAELLAMTKLPDGTEDDGILPQVVRRLVQSRRDVKAAMKSEKDPKRLQIMEIRQKALKLTANSLYGTLGFQNSRFYAKPLAAIITAKGREALNNTITVVNQEVALDVVYGDTDSIFVNSKTNDYDQAMQAANQIKRAVNKRYKRLEIEIDGVFSRLLLLKKKKYAARKIVAWSADTTKRVFEREVKGLDMVRRDWCGLAKELGDGILSQILEGAEGKEAAVHWIHNFLSEKRIELDSGSIDVKKFVITKALTKAPKDYPDAKNQPHVQVALRLMARGKSVTVGQEMEYVVCEQVDGQSAKVGVADRAYHPHELDMNPSLKIDVAWYKSQQLHPVIARMLCCVEGTDAARLAECLGMDAHRFAKVEVHDDFESHAAYTEAAGADVAAALDRKMRWKNMTTRLPGTVCPLCEHQITWEAMLSPEVRPETEPVTELFRCGNCKVELNPVVARNMLTMQLRQLLREHCEGWVRTGEDATGATVRTRRGKTGVSEVGERTLMRELEYIEHLCESADSFKGVHDERRCRESARGMKEASQRLLACNGNNWINCGQLFSGIFG